MYIGALEAHPSASAAQHEAILEPYPVIMEAHPVVMQAFPMDMEPSKKKITLGYQFDKSGDASRRDTGLRADFDMKWVLKIVQSKNAFNCVGSVSRPLTLQLSQQNSKKIAWDVLG
jgi:hypothetical protein